MMYSICSKEGEEAKKLCNQQMMVINAAYKVLKDPRKRAEYDRKRRISGGSSWGASDVRSMDSDRNVGGGGGGSSSSSYWSRSYDEWGTSTGSVNENEDGESLADILSELWEELNTNGAVNLIDDLMSYLDVEVN